MARIEVFISANIRTFSLSGDKAAAYATLPPPPRAPCSSSVGSSRRRGVERKPVLILRL
jgi:hypothetical protein